MTDGMKSFSPVRMTASTEEAAIQQALQLIGATRDEVTIEVLQRDAKGVTVRVGPRREESPSSAQEAPPVSTNHNGEAPRIEDNIEATGIQSEDDAFSTGDNHIGDDLAQVDVATPDTEAIEAIGDVTQSEGSSLAESPSAAPAGQASTPVQPAVAQHPVQPVDPATQEKARALAQEFLDRMGMDAQVRVIPPPGASLETSDEGSPSAPESGRPAARLYLQVEGEDVGILIGKHGQTLQAFQYLLNITLNNRPAGDGEGREGADQALRVIVDAGGYRARRAEALEQAAQDAATRARRDRRSIRLEPMPAHERRLIHLALREDNTVTTSSEGREPLRHVVVTPAGARPASAGGGERSYGADRGGFNQRGRGGYGGGNRSGGSGRGGGGGYGRQRGGSR
jgi:spoIIIJ-associated protein